MQEAIGRDPSYALAHAGLADAYNMLGRRAEARAAALEALRLDPDLAEPHATLGSLYMFQDWNRADAERELWTAIRLKPSYPTAHHWYAYFLAATGLTAGAVGEMQRAVALDPVSPIILRRPRSRQRSHAELSRSDPGSVYRTASSGGADPTTSNS